MQGCRKGLSMLDIKRVLKAAPTKMRSREPLQQLWTPWGERIDHEWLSARAGNKAFNPAEEGERTLDEGRTPILGEHPRPTMVRDNCTMLNGWWDYAIASIPEDDLPILFAPFYRVEKSRNKTTGGSGLGLYITKAILDQHGFSYRLENTNSGVRFTMEFCNKAEPKRGIAPRAICN